MCFQPVWSTVNSLNCFTSEAYYYSCLDSTNQPCSRKKKKNMNEDKEAVLFSLCQSHTHPVLLVNPERVRWTSLIKYES